MKIKERPKLKTSELIELCKKKFPINSYYSNEQLDKDFPAPKEATVREFADSIEPDKDTLGQSAQKADPNQEGITLRERLIMELEYFEKTGGHLDVENVTLCSGSRHSDGRVPSVYLYYDGGVSVGWSSLGFSFPDCGIRRAVNPLNSYLDEAIKVVKSAGYKVFKEI